MKAPEAPRPAADKATGFEGPANASYNTYLKGEIVSFDDGVLSKACALASNLLRPFGILVESCSHGEISRYSDSGQQYVRVQSGDSPNGGDPVYLSPSEAGTVTTTRPTSGNMVWTLGQFSGPVNRDGVAPMLPNIAGSGSAVL